MLVGELQQTVAELRQECWLRAGGVEVRKWEGGDEIRTQRTKGHYLREWRWVVKFSAMVLGFITTRTIPPRAPVCALAAHSTWQFPMGEWHMRPAVPGPNLAMFGLQSATAPLQSATFRTAPHALGATRGMCGFPGNRRGSAHFRYFAAQTQQMCAPWSASTARPAGFMHTTHTTTISTCASGHMHTASTSTCTLQSSQIKCTMHST